MVQLGSGRSSNVREERAGGPRMYIYMYISQNSIVYISGLDGPCCLMHPTWCSSEAREGEAKCLDLLSLLSCMMCNRAHPQWMAETKTQQHKEPQQQEKHSNECFYCCWGSGLPVCCARGAGGPRMYISHKFNCTYFRAGWPILDMHLEWHRKRRQIPAVGKKECVSVCTCFVCEALQMKGLESPGYMYIYIHIIVYFRLDGPFCVTHTKICLRDHRSAGWPFFHKGKGKGEDGTGRGEDREGGGYIGVVWGGGVGLCVRWGGRWPWAGWPFAE